MATTSRYTLQGTGANFMDFYIPYGDISLDGQEIVFKGNSGVDAVYVGNGTGLVFDFTQAGLAVDKIYLSGDWADYSRSYSGSVVTLTQTNGGTEIIKTISGDSLVFANGTVSVLDALNFLKGTAAEPVPAGDTSAGFPVAVTGPLNNSVRAVVQDAAGETIALARPGVTMIVKGGSGVDVVYATPGTNVDGTLLGLGQDKLYLAGGWAEYDRSYSGSVVTLTRTVGSDTETVQFLGGSLTAYDSVVFTDGMAKSVDILNYLKGTAAAPILNTAEVTPLPGPAVAITTDDNALNVGDTAIITFTLSEAPANSTTFVQGDVTVTGGTLSNFSGSGITYTATFTPIDSTEGNASISIASGVFQNADAQDNSAASLSLAVDTISPTTPTVSLASDTGYSNSDRITSNAALTVSDPAVGVTRTYTVDGGSPASSYTAPTGQGSHTVSVTDADAAGNTATTSLTFTFDTVAPTATLSNAVYNDNTNILAITGTNFDTLGVANGTDVKSQLDWSKFTWDINGDNTTTTDKIIAAENIASAVVSNTTTLTLTLTDSAGTALEAMTGFGDTGGFDKLDVAVGFLKDAAGNVATADGLTNGSLVADSVAPTTTLTSAAYNGGTGVLTVTGTNLDTLGVVNGTDVKSQLNWANISWDINGDDGTTANKTFVVGDITSAVVTNSTALTITLTSSAKTALEATVGFAATGGADKLDVTAGFIKDTAGNAAAGDALANGAISYSDVTAPMVASFSSTTANGAYNGGSTINITATMSETVTAGSTFNVTLDTTDVVTLTAASAGTTLTGTYTVDNGDTSADLTVSSFAAGTVTDVYGNAMTSTTLPSGQNLANNAALVIDITAPTTTLTSAAYNGGTGVLTVTGSNLDTLGVANGTDIKSNLNWTNFVWDINGDNATTTDKTFALSDITSAVVTNATTLTITLTAGAKTALEGTTGFAAAGGADKLDVTAGFIRDTAGNAATTDALANGAITYSDVTAPTVASFSSTTANGAYNAGDTINITATMSETVLAGATFAVTLDTTDVVTLTAGSTGTTLSGSYTVGAGDSSADMTVSSYTAGTVSDVYGNAMATTSLPSGQNLANNAALVIDTTAPTTTLTSAAYDGGTGVLTVTGSNLDTLGVANGADVKAQLDWTKIAWDINGDGATTADKTFAAGDITSAVVTNATTLTITLTAGAKTALEATAGFAAAGGADKLDVTAGFIRDTAGNAATTDALANGAITHTGVAVPSVSYSSTTFNEAGANNGSITATSIITLASDTFTGTTGALLSGAVVTNVPVGLTAVVTKTSDTTATLSFTGNATAHADVNDIANLTVTMGNAAFTSGNASAVTDATKSDLSVNFADVGAIFNGDGTAQVLNGTAAEDIIYGGGGADTINAGAGNDMIDITDAGTTILSSSSIVVTSVANGTDTIIGFSAAALDNGGDVLNFSAIAGLTDSVATGQTLTTDFAANNVFLFGDTPVTIADAAGAIAADVSVVATAGYIVIADSANNNAVTVYHSTDLAANGTETALAILSGVTISNLTATNFIV